jgi:hypothetical protein
MYIHTYTHTYSCEAAIAQSVYKLDYGIGDLGSIPGRGNDDIVCLRHRVETGSGANPAPVQWIPGALTSGGKAAGV